MRRLVIWFGLGVFLVVIPCGGVAVVELLLSDKGGNVRGWPFPPRKPRPALPPPKDLPDAEPPFVPVPAFTVSAAGLALAAYVPPEVKPLAPAAVPTLTPSRRLGEARPNGPQIGQMAANRDGKVLAFVGPGVVVVWDVAAGKPLRTLPTPDYDGISRVALSPDGATLYASEPDKSYRSRATLRVWDVASGKQLRERPIGLWALSADGKTLATVDVHRGTFDRGFSPGDDTPEVPPRSTLALWNATDLTLQRAFTYTSFVPESLAASSDGATVVCANGNAVRAFDGNTGKALWKQEFTYANGNAWHDIALAVSPDGSAVAVGCTGEYADPRAVRLFDTATGKGRALVEFAGHIMYDRPKFAGMAFTPDSKMLIAAFDYGVVPMDLATWTMPAERAGRKERPDEQYEFTRRGIQPADFAPRSFTLSGDGKTAFLGTDYTVNDPCGLRVVDVASRRMTYPATLAKRVVAPFRQADHFFPRPLNGVHYPTWVELASGRKFHWPGWLSQLHRVAAGEKLEALPFASVYGYEVTPDGETLVTRGVIDGTRDDDPRIRFRDGVTGMAWTDVIGPALQQARDRRALRLSPDGRTLAALHPDGCVWLWEVATARPRARLAGAGPEGVYWLDFTADGRHVMSHDRYMLTGHVWDLAGEPKAAPDAAERARLWDALRGDDAAAAYAAINRLAAHPADAVAFLKGKAKDVPDVTDADRLAARPFDKDIVLARRFVEVLDRCGTADAAALRKELASRPAFTPPKPTPK